MSLVFHCCVPEWYLLHLAPLMFDAVGDESHTDIRFGIKLRHFALIRRIRQLESRLHYRSGFQPGGRKPFLEGSRVDILCIQL